MSNKQYIVGRETVAMIAQAAEWGFSTSGTSGLLFEEATVNWNQTNKTLTTNDSFWNKHCEPGLIESTLEITQPFMFNDMMLLALCLGSSQYQTPVEQNTDQADYLHIIQPATSTNGEFATLAFKRSANIVNTFPSCKVTGFEITGSPDPNRIRIKHSIVANTVVNGPDGLSTTFDSLLYPYDQRGYFRNCRFFMNNSEATELSSGDEITNLISEFSFSFKRNMTKINTNTSGLCIDEPLDDQAPDIKLKLGFAYKDDLAASLFSERLAGNTKKLRIVITAGPANPQATGSVENASLVIDMPCMMIIDDSFTSFSSMDRQESDVSFDILAPPDADTPGMAFTTPFQLQIINNRANPAISLA